MTSKYINRRMVNHMVQERRQVAVSSVNGHWNTSDADSDRATYNVWVHGIAKLSYSPTTGSWYCPARDSTNFYGRGAKSNLPLHIALSRRFRIDDITPIPQKEFEWLMMNGYKSLVKEKLEGLFDAHA